MCTLVIGKAKLDRKKQITMIIAINKKPKLVRIIVWTMEGRGNTRVQARGAEKGGKKGKNAAKKRKKKQNKKRARDLWVCVRHDACLLGEKCDAYAPACTLGGSLNFTESRDWTKRRRGGDMR